MLSYRRALALKPDLRRAHYNIGLARQAQGNLTEAEASYGRALALKPDYPEAHSNLGNTLQAQGKLAEAVACYGRALVAQAELRRGAQQPRQCAQGAGEARGGGGLFRTGVGS